MLEKIRCCWNQSYDGQSVPTSENVSGIGQATQKSLDSSLSAVSAYLHHR